MLIWYCICVHYRGIGKSLEISLVGGLYAKDT